MRKPAPDASAAAQLQAAPSAHAQDPTGAGANGHLARHGHELPAGAGAYGGVIVGNIGTDHASKDSALAVQAASASPSSLQQLDQREERAKKSVAYRHTSLFNLVLDSFGKEYEKRTCSYCTAVFSFKGGTTSAALRHLKTAHPERIAYAGVADNGFDGSSMNGAANIVQYGDSAPVALNQSGHVMVDGITEEDGGQHQQEHDSEPLSQEKASRSKARLPAKRKRQRDDAESGVNGDHHSGSAGPKHAPTLTASQTAITHFLQHYKEMLSLPNRLRFVKHLTHHPSEAEMYNVLDDATQMEYVREFSDSHVTTI